ncbi:general secretion pathway protein GspK [Pseudomonas sp. DC3200b2]|uniref:general secretion pathway protein GspK n=1 Tax=Pseudomonas sp. DC3200b2 TaxID=2804669 RepID=UPI003CFB271F
MSRQRGMALLVTLWVVALLSGVLAAVAGTVRLELRQARWQRQSTQAVLAAEAGISLAVLGLQANSPRLRWLADGQVHEHAFDGAILRISARSERGKLDLNSAPASTMVRFLQAFGADGPSAAQLTAALAHQREHSPLRTPEELRPLPGMSATLHERIAPFITVWSGQAQPDAALAAAPLARALGLPRVAGMALEPGQIFTITSRAHLPNGARATVRATLLMITAKEGAKPYRVLRWQT